VRTTTRTSGALAALLALSLAATACTGAGQVAETDGPDLSVSTGVTDDSIVIGTHQPLTGPAAPGYMSISRGAAAVFDYVNEQGGVHGRPVEIIVRDDQPPPSARLLPPMWST
jgi:branched-chain amino acid transport system substrate-binding protein